MRTVSAHSVNFLTKRGEKNGKENKKEKERGRPQSPDQAKGRQGQDKGAASGGEKRNLFRLC